MSVGEDKPGAISPGYEGLKAVQTLAIRALQAANEVCKAARSPLPAFTSRVLAAAKSVTGATWVELLLLQGDRLLVCPSGEDQKFVMKQVRQHFEVTTGSLAGLVATSGVAKNFSSPNISAFYKNSTNRLTPYSPVTFQQEETWSVAALPIDNPEKIRSGVLVLFNKKDDRCSQTFFTDSDLTLCQELCETIGAVLDLRRSFDSAKGEIQALSQLFTQRNGLVDAFLQSFGKKKRFKQILKAVKSARELTPEVMQVVAETLEFDAVLVHVVKEDKLDLRMSIGLPSEKYQAMSATYCAFSAQEPLTVPDILTDPLYSQCKFHMKSAMCYPLIKNHATVAVFEAMRRVGSFTERDMALLERLVKAVEHIPVKAFRRFGEKEAQPVRADSLVTYLKQFSIPRKEEMFDYVKMFNAIETASKRLFRCSMCSTYFCDEAREIIWTRKSDSCDPLTFPRSSHSLLGYLSTRRTQTPFPLSEDLATKKDAPAYSKANGVCTPILSTYMSEEHVLGIIVLVRDDPLTSSELARVSALAEVISECLLILFFDRSYRKTRTNTLRRASSFLEVNIQETVLQREQHSGKPHAAGGEAPAPLLQLIPDLLTLSQSAVQRLAAISASLCTAADPLKSLADRLAEVLQCDTARLLLLDIDRRLLVDQSTRNQFLPSGLTSVCMASQSALAMGTEVRSHPDFNPVIDSDGNATIDSIAIVPVLCFGNRTEGVIIAVNCPLDALTTLKLIASVVRDVIVAKDDTAVSWRTVVQTERRQKMLVKWCGEIFRVLILSQERTLKCSSIRNRLHMAPELPDLLAITLETLSLILNSEGARLVIKHPGAAAFSQFTRESGLSPVTAPLSASLAYSFDRCISQTSTSTLPYHNSLTIPVLYSHEPVAVVELWNKRDEGLTAFMDFGISDEAVVSDICQHLGAPCQALVTNAGNAESAALIAVLKERSWAINNYALLSTIRRACKALLDCDRASVFLVEGDKLVIRPQGNDSEIPVGISVPVGVGVVGSVAKSGKTVMLEDVYHDPRFSPAVDMKTGYRTRTMLCAPVMAQGRVIAALQMINKGNGLFDEKDAEVLEMFCDLAASALESMHLFETVIAEQRMYTDILNGLGCAIVLLRDGLLDFSNRSVEQLLGVPEAFAVSHHYSQWQTLAPSLSADIDAVQEKRSQSARKKFQILQNRDLEDRRYDYRIVAVEAEGAVKQRLMLVFEEISSKGQLNSPTLLGKSGVRSQTTLQACIKQLTEVMEKTDAEVKASLEFVVHTLKSGNLHHTKIILEEAGLASGLDPEIMQQTLTLPTVKPRRSAELLGFPSPEQLPSDISLEDLRDWNLDFATIHRESPYILAMLQDFNLLSELRVPELHNFLAEAKALYSHRKNPFHNFAHACCVMHNVYCVLTRTVAGKLFEDWEVLSLLVGALGHDLDHTGRTNSFETSRESVLALRYHDTSVLEQHHAATLFLTLQKPSCNFLADFDTSTKRLMRKFIIEVILATDMAKHMAMVANMQARLKELEEEPLGSRPNDKKEAGEMLLHCADLSNPTKAFDVCYRWSRRLQKEFQAQVREEQEMNLPVTGYMTDLQKPTVFLKNEVAFYSVIVKPLWECFGEWLSPGTDLALTQLNSNIETLKKMLEDAQSDVS